MLKYILKRLLIFVPTLFIVSVLIFMLKNAAPGDPAIPEGGLNGGGMDLSTNFEEEYEQQKKKRNLDLPLFYFAIKTQADTDTLHRVLFLSDQDNLKRLIWKYGNWPAIEQYFHAVQALNQQAQNTVLDSVNNESLDRIRIYASNLRNSYKEDEVTNYLKDIKAYLANVNTLQHLKPLAQNTQAAYDNMVATQTPHKYYLPAIHFHGLNNQYHKWASAFLRLDFGTSYFNDQPVIKKISEQLFWTVLLSFLAVFFSYLIAIPLGVFSATRKGKRSDNIVTTILFMLYSLPSFWVATLLITFLTQPQWLTIFPPNGLGRVSASMSWLEVVNLRAYHLVLPLICWTYPALAFLSRQMRGGMLNVLGQDYIRTARAKGLEEKKIVWKHAFRNSLMPIITMFSNIFPRLIAGSVVLEVIFSLPGLGKLLFDSISSNDSPVVFAMVMFTAILTMIGYLIADIFYALADPRVTFDK